jgi:outer membrane receptor protein involved in Fe transport
LNKAILTFTLSLVFCTILFGQSVNTQSRGIISGVILDSETNNPIEYSNVVLFNQKDSSQVAGTVSDKTGTFRLIRIPNGDFYLTIQFVGYEKKVIKDILVSSSQSHVDLGNILLKPTAIRMKNVVVNGKRAPISYQLDKKVIDVTQMHTSAAGNAADVLQNIPSVNVDIDGNVSLRGSTNFTVMVNGRTSVLSAQDALQQIPVSSIQSIEIITNPSAKYDASGSAGIINIVLKKSKILGFSGIVNLDAGLRDKYGGNVIFQYKAKSINYNFGFDFNRRGFPGSNRQEKQFILGDTISTLNSNGNMLWQRITTGVRGGLDFDFGENTSLSLGGSYGSRSHRRNSTLNYAQLSNLGISPFYYLNNSNHNSSGPYYELNMNFLQNFGPNGHQLTGDLSYRYNSSNEATESIGTQGAAEVNGTKTTEQGPENETRGKLDYTLPINQTSKFSAGSEFFSRISQDINKLYMFDTTSHSYNFESQFSHTNDFNRTRFAAYSLYSNQWDSLGVQFGLRAEYTYQFVKLAETGQQFSLSRWDIFPSINSSYNFAGGTQMMASYSRRIDRPDGGDLEPFYTWFDANDVRIGNPNVKPELIDSYELGFQTFVGKISLSTDLYYRYTHDKRQDINSVYAENVTLRTVANVGHDQSAGTELMILFNPLAFWDFNFSGDLYDYKISGAINSESFARESFNWSIKNQNVFNIGGSTEIQLNTRYYSPSVTAQGKWNGYFTTDMAIKQDLVKNELSLILQVNDLFQTGKREFTSQGIDFYNYNYYSRKSPSVILNLKYNFNNYKEKGSQENNQQDNVTD